MRGPTNENTVATILGPGFRLWITTRPDGRFDVYVFGDGPSHDEHGRPRKPQRRAVRLTWHDAMDYCRDDVAQQAGEEAKPAQAYDRITLMLQSFDEDSTYDRVSTAIEERFPGIRIVPSKSSTQCDGPTAIREEVEDFAEQLRREFR